MVLPTPGTSSIRMWPRLSSAITQSSISAALPTSTRPTFSTIRDPSASTDPFSTCILLYFLFDDPVPLGPTSSDPRTRSTAFSLPRGAPPHQAGGQTSDRTATQNEYVVDDQPKRVQTGRAQRRDGTDRARQFRHHHQPHSHNDASPDTAPDCPDQTN